MGLYVVRSMVDRTSWIGRGDAVRDTLADAEVHADREMALLKAIKHPTPCSVVEI